MIKTHISVEGLKQIVDKLTALKQQSEIDDDLDIVVGYAADHATYVHEINANYNNGKQWKYLETPYRELRGQFAKNIVQSYKRTRSIRSGLSKSAKQLYQASQDIVPVDTGELKASGFIAWNYEVENKAQAAYQRGKAKRSATLKRRARQQRRR